MKQLLWTINLKFKIKIHLYVRRTTAALNHSFYYSTNINEIFKVVIHFKKLDKIIWTNPV